jgi:hypothetical protein
LETFFNEWGKNIFGKIPKIPVKLSKNVRELRIDGKEINN